MALPSRLETNSLALVLGTISVIEGAIVGQFWYMKTPKRFWCPLATPVMKENTPVLSVDHQPSS
eukprot:scaffold1843_cov87-Cylindrotheca_fusiformis.AAC.2